MADATSLPVIAASDAGYGNAVNVIRTVTAFERAGISAIHLEDQALPKKCGAFPDKVLVVRPDGLLGESGATTASKARSKRL